MANLTKEEYALLSEFSYIDLPEDVVKQLNMADSDDGLSFGRVLNYLNNYIENKKYLTDDQVILINKMINSPAICDLQFVQYENKDALVGASHENLIEKFKLINKKLAKIDRDLDWLLARVIVDFNPFHAFQNLKSGYKVATSDLKISTSLLIYNCISWLQEVGNEFKNTERANVDRVKAISTPPPLPEANNVVMFR
jgi:hypothetical protein